MADDDVEALLLRAVPRLGRDDAGAAKVRARLVAMAFAAWERGPSRLARLGVEVEAAPPLPDGPEARRLAALRRALGGARFVALFQALRDELARAVAEKKASSGGHDAAPARERGASSGAHDAAPARERPGSSSGRRRAASSSGRSRRASSGSHRASSGGGASSGAGRGGASSGAGRSGRARRAAPSGEGGLTISSSSDATASSGEGPGLAVPDDEPLRLADDAAPAPLGIRFDDDAPAAAPAAGAKPAPADDEDDRPDRAAERALARFRERGDEEELAAARRLFAEAAKAADSPVARGAARGGAAYALLLAGEVEKAAAQAEKALAHFPGEPRAVEVALRAARPGEGERARVEAALARARAALTHGDVRAAEAAARDLDALAPREPFGPLVALAAWQAQDARDGDPAPRIAAAWERYPASGALAALPLGAAIERPVVLACLGWVRRRIEQEGGAVLAQTVKDVERKDNVVAGAVHLALGTARAALATRARLDRHEEQELRKWAGQALLCAQYYDHAKEVLGRARSVDRNDPQVLEINKDETLCGVMRRAFDKPGVKHRAGTLDGVGLLALRKAVAARLQQVLAQRDEALGGYEKDEAAAVEALAADPARRAALAARAAAAGVSDPLARLAAVDEERARLAAEAAALGAEPGAPAPEAPGRLFGRMKAGLTKALDKAKAAARAAQLGLERGVADSRRAEALRGLAVGLRDRPDGGWGDEALDALHRRWDALAARVAFLDEEAEALRKVAERAGDA